MINLTLEEAIQQYIESFDTYEKIAYKIAKQNLESSFDIEKSIGFKQFIEKIKLRLLNFLFL